MLTMFLYILRLREFVASDEPVWKVGYTARNILDRMREYPKNSQLIATMRVSDPLRAERELLVNMRSRPDIIKERRDLGKEYFECPLELVVQIWSEVTTKYLHATGGDRDMDIDPTPVVTLPAEPTSVPETPNVPLSASRPSSSSFKIPIQRPLMKKKQQAKQKPAKPNVVIHWLEQNLKLSDNGSECVRVRDLWHRFVKEKGIVPKKSFVDTVRDWLMSLGRSTDLMKHKGESGSKHTIVRGMTTT
jgi:hypothetical protein